MMSYTISFNRFMMFSAPQQKHYNAIEKQYKSNEIKTQQKPFNIQSSDIQECHRNGTNYKPKKLVSKWSTSNDNQKKQYDLICFQFNKNIVMLLENTISEPNEIKKTLNTLIYYTWIQICIHDSLKIITQMRIKNQLITMFQPQR